jgi:hypothetical protein
MATKPTAVENGGWRDSLVRLAGIAVHSWGAPDCWPCLAQQIHILQDRGDPVKDTVDFHYSRHGMKLVL